MKKTSLPVVILFTAIMASACGRVSNDGYVTSADSTLADGHNSANSVDWSGTYYGVLPCASCEGIETTLTLNDDRTFRLSTKYQGEPADTSTYVVEGSFTWNDAGNTVTLQGVEDGPSQYFVGERELYQLDMSGNRVTGPLAANYKLGKKMNASSAWTSGLQDQKWVLTELGGNAVPPPSNPADQAYFILASDGRVTGNAGCNSFGGGYRLETDNRIRFAQMERTLKACADMTVETEFMNVLERADSYTISDTMLVLNRARMAPLARFRRG